MMEARRSIKPGARLIEVAESAERYLRDKGVGLAFPINLSIDANAAHYSPSLGDESVFQENSLVKVDFGAEIGGMLGDGALSVDLSGNNGKMIETAEAALDDALSMVKTGVTVRQIGAAISGRVEGAGFKPILNLGGHMVKRNALHAGTFIPNFDNGDDTRLEEGDVIAIEPFITGRNGRGLVRDGDYCEIYEYAGSASTRSPDARALLSEIESKYPSNPFAVRWLSGIIGPRFRLYSAVRELLRAGAISPHPVLVEAANAPVAQAEAELMVENGGCKIITRVKA